MNITLRNIKIHEDMSEETNCFSAAIYLNGKQVGEVKNQGSGACHSYYWSDKEAGKKITAYAKEQETKFAFEKLDQFVDKLIKEEENLRVLRQLKKWTTKETLFRLKGDKRGAWRTLNARYEEKVVTWLRNKYANQIECIANESLEKALQYS